MKINTRKFGMIDIAENKVVNMPIGLPGFANHKRFVILDREETRPFHWLQSVDDPDLALVIMNPFLIVPDYAVNRPAVSKEMDWAEEDMEHFAFFVVVNASEAKKTVTANLLGPIVVNTKRQEAVQVIVYDSAYSYQHPVIQYN